MVTKHKREQFPDALLEQTFQRTSLINGLLAVLAGIVSHFLETSFKLGPIGPFQAAIALTILALLLVLTWEENYGESSSSAADAPTTKRKRASKSASAAKAADGGDGGDGGGDGEGVIASLLHAAKLMRADPRLWILGIMQVATPVTTPSPSHPAVTSHPHPHLWASPLTSGPHPWPSPFRSHALALPAPPLATL